MSKQRRPNPAGRVQSRPVLVGAAGGYVSVGFPGTMADTNVAAAEHLVARLRRAIAQAKAVPAEAGRR